MAWTQLLSFLAVQTVCPCYDESHNPMTFPAPVPEIPAANVDKAAAYYVNTLGFTFDGSKESLRSSGETPASPAANRLQRGPQDLESSTAITACCYRGLNPSPSQIPLRLIRLRRCPLAARATPGEKPSMVHLLKHFRLVR
jgi:hypothetical protein